MGADSGRRAFAAGVALTALRLWVVAGVPPGDDEAYYGVWARTLDWSYFDHPGGVAWLIRASVAVFGEHPWSLRLPFIISGLLAGVALQRVGRQLFPATPQVGDLASIALHLSPLFAICSVFAAPDMPLVAAGLWAIWAGLRVSSRGAVPGGGEGPQLLGWTLLGGCLAAAAAMKLHAVLWVPPMLWLAWPHRRSLGPWLALAMGLVGLWPTLAWNAARDMMGVAFHLSGRHGHQVRARDGLGQFLGGQLALVSPVLLFAALAGLREARRSAAPGARNVARLLMLCVLPAVVGFGLLSAVTRTKPHWTALAWAVAMLPAAAWLLPRPRTRAVGLFLAALTSGVVYLQAATGWLPISPPSADPTREMVGWETATEHAILLRNTARVPERTMLIAGRYQQSAQLAWHAGAGVPVTRVGGRADQFDVWGRGQFEGWDAVFVDHDQYPSGVDRAACFAACAPAGEWQSSRRGRPLRTFHFWRCVDFRAARCAR